MKELLSQDLHRKETDNSQDQHCSPIKLNEDEIEPQEDSKVDVESDIKEAARTDSKRDNF